MAKFSLLTTLTLNATGYNKGVDKAKAKTRQFSSGVEQASKSIKGSFGQISSLAGGLGGEFGVLADSVGTGVGAFKKMIPAINSFKTALISTGIGALVVGLGTAIGALTTYFKRTEEGQMVFKKVMNAVSAYIEPVLSLLGTLGKAVVELFQGKFKQAWQTAKSGFKEVGGAIKDNVSNLDELNAKEQELLTLQRENLLKNKKLEAEISELRNKAKDTEKYSAEQRLKYSNQAIALQKEYSANRQKEADLELSIAEIKASFGDNDIETNNELNELRSRQYDIQKEQADKLREIYETQRSITKEAKAEAIARVRATEEAYQALAGKKIKGKEASIDVTANTDTSKLDDMSSFMQQNTSDADLYNQQLERSQNLWTKLGENVSNTQFLVETFGTAINGITEAFNGFFDGTKSGFKDVVTAMLSGVGSIINALLAEAIAGMIAKEAHKGILGLATASIGVGILTALWKTKVPAFATGGIVDGTSYTGDNVIARVNSGEMILNSQQQKRLFALANGSGGLGGEVRFEIAGDKLYGVLNNYNRKINNFN